MTDLNTLKQSLGINNQIFSDFDVKVTEKEVIKPYYKKNFEQYKKQYQQKIENEGYPLSESSMTDLNTLKQSLGINNQIFPDFDVKITEKEVIKPYYKNNLKQYAEEYEQQLIHKKPSVSHKICKTLKGREKKLGLRNEDISIVEDLINHNWTINHLIYADCGINYWKLRELLVEQKWKEADQQTRVIMLQISGREGKGNLNRKSIRNFPDKDLFTIDKLWVEYSQSKFGFRVQKKIFEDLKQNKEDFLEKVGWRKKAGLFKGFFAWKSYDELTFSLEAPEGHLPIWGNNQKKFFEDHFVFVFSKFRILPSHSFDISKTDILKAYQKQKYQKEFIQKLEKEGFCLKVNKIHQIEELRESFTLLVKEDCIKIEESVIKDFYQKNLLHYQQEVLEKIKQKREKILVSYKTCVELKHLYKSLKLRIEDIELIEGLIKNNWTIDHLISSVFQVDYWGLRKLLINKEWQYADEQTKVIILKIANRESQQNLDNQSIKNFSAKDLFTVDQLWVKYSDGKFGFSVQKKIFESLNQDKEVFAEKVGWKKKAGLLRTFLSEKSYNQLTFNSDAPKGHFPVWGVKDRKLFGNDFIHFRLWNFDY